MRICTDKGKKFLLPKKPGLLYRIVRIISCCHHGNHIGIARTGGHLPFTLYKADQIKHLINHIFFKDG